MPETAPSYEEWRDAMFRILGETEYFTSLRARASWNPATSKGAGEALNAVWDLYDDDDYDGESCRWWRRCEETLTPGTRLQWLAAHCRESGRHAGDRIRAEEFATLLYIIVNCGHWHWIRALRTPECREQAIDAVRSFAVLYRDFFGPLLGDDLTPGPGEPNANFTQVHFLCSMLWDMSPLGILEGPVRDAEREVLAQALELPWLSCHESALLGISCYGDDPAFAELARAYVRREPRPSGRLRSRAGWAAGEDD